MTKDKTQNKSAAQPRFFASFLFPQRRKATPFFFGTSPISQTRPHTHTHTTHHASPAGADVEMKDDGKKEEVKAPPKEVDVLETVRAWGTETGNDAHRRCIFCAKTKGMGRSAVAHMTQRPRVSTAPFLHSCILVPVPVFGMHRHMRRPEISKHFLASYF
jgi:hypothetical protein